MGGVAAAVKGGKSGRGSQTGKVLIEATSACFAGFSNDRNYLYKFCMSLLITHLL